MAGVQEQIYQPSSGVGAATPIPGVSAESYGAGVGQALEQAGSQLEDSRLRALRAEKQRQDESDNAAAAAGSAQLSLSLTQMAEAARDQAPVDGSGHVETVTGGADKLIGDYLGTIKDPQVRDRWASHVAELRANLIGDEDGWARGMRIQSVKTNAVTAQQLQNNQLQENPDPHSFDAALKAGALFWEGANAPANVKADGVREWNEGAAYNYAHGLNEQNPVAGLAVLHSPLLDQYLTPEHKKALVNEAQTNIRIAAADANRQVSQAAEQVRADASGLHSSISQGVLVPDDQVSTVVTRAQALVAKYPEMKNVAEGLQYDLGVLKESRITDKWTLKDWSDNVDPLAAKVAQGKASDDEQRQLKILEQLRPGKEARFRNNPDQAASASGIPVPQFDPDHPETAAARAAWAEPWAKTAHLTEPPYLNKDQLEAYRQRAAQGPVAQLDAADELRQTWGAQRAASIVRQIGGEPAADMRVMLGLNPAIAQLYRRGHDALDKKAVELNDDLARQAWGIYSRGVPPDLQPAVFDAARKIAGGLMQRQGFTKPPGNFSDVFAEALQYAAGRTGNVKDFRSPGGLAELNGRYAWLPGDMSSNDFLHRVVRAQPQDWVRAATDDRGNPVDAVPHYMGSDGKLKPYTKGDALNFGKGTLTSLDQGLYHLNDTFGHTVVDQSGRPWTFDVRRLHPGSAAAAHQPNALAPNQYDRSTWATRADGSAKGTGFLGVIKRPDGKVSSEISVGLPINGKEMDIPTMVPGLTHSELNWLLTTPTSRIAKELPPGIRQKAIAHAKQRIAAGLSPFKQDNER